ncbi:hypothetical protein [Planktothrix sp. FACHB-1365]|uniref:hypothetical protein n=1 Tax=Planktothrix sp. FACHB-1365 TaxID=2692855 RepID=UPI0016838D44|nr:hypothetical protein [Planktothrix sp. FACHB-1365]MBD2485871.1 hypothetical protein [Planktothrix sp. FACHB-1365]
MPYICDGENINLIAPEIDIEYILSLPKLTLIPDTEYTQKHSMIVDGVGIYSPQLAKDKGFVWLYDELTPDFHPIINTLEVVGIRSSVPHYLDILLEELGEVEESIFDDVKNPKKAYETALKEGYFSEFFNKYNLTEDNIIYKRNSKDKTSSLIIKPESILVELGFFFQHADLFKIWGRNHQDWLLNTARISQYRVLKLMGSNDNKCMYLDIENRLIEVKISLREYMYRFPPRKKGLDEQAKIFSVGSRKIDIKRDDVAIKLGIKKEEIMENMSLLRENLIEEFINYLTVDLFTSHGLDVTQRELLHVLRNTFNLDDVEISDTTGANVSKFIVNLISKNFNQSSDSEEYKQNEAIIKNQMKLTRIDNLQDIELNDFGYQIFLTVGGLLFSRMVEYPYLEGNFGDLDQQSCYATAMSNLKVYLGEPKVVTFKYKHKPKLREVAAFVKQKNIPNDAFFIRVSGKFIKAINTLILSDLRFVSKKLKNPEIIPFNTDIQSSAMVASNPSRYGINDSKKMLGGFNNDKVGKKLAVSTLLLKEVKFGLVNYDILEAIQLLPDEWVEEYLDLDVNSLVYFAPELIVDTLEELEEKRAQLPDEPILQKFDFEKEINSHTSQNYKNNVTLRFDIGAIWGELKTNRNKYKKEKNPVQEVLKLFQNSGYGVLACLYLATNNLMASNQITAQARVGAWLMTNSLNGFAPITDGTGFCWDTIPIGLKFKDILNNSPEYLFKYDISIKSGLTLLENRQKWINEKFKKYMANFYQVDVNHHLIQKFDYELKTEIFETQKGESIETDLFTIYINSNSGNYIKGMGDCSVMLNEISYDFIHQIDYLKARSYHANDELIKWYSESLRDGYKTPLIYSENSILKFGDGTQKVIQFLKEVDQIVHPMGFSMKVFKMMKLISRSQFLFLNESQLRNFETNENKLAEISKLFTSKKFWEEFKHDEKIEGVNYHEFSKNHSTGVGFEILALMKKYNGSIQAIRQLIQGKILEGCKDFNAGLHLDRTVEKVLNDEIKKVLATVIMLKKNEDIKLKNTLLNSLNEPTLLVVGRENVHTLDEVWSEEE